MQGCSTDDTNHDTTKHAITRRPTQTLTRGPHQLWPMQTVTMAHTKHDTTWQRVRTMTLREVHTNTTRASLRLKGQVCPCMWKDKCVLASASLRVEGQVRPCVCVLASGRTSASLRLRPRVTRASLRLEAGLGCGIGPILDRAGRRTGMGYGIEPILRLGSGDGRWAWISSFRIACSGRVSSWVSSFRIGCRPFAFFRIGSMPPFRTEARLGHRIGAL